MTQAIENTHEEKERILGCLVPPSQKNEQIKFLLEWKQEKLKWNVKLGKNLRLIRVSLRELMELCPEQRKKQMKNQAQHLQQVLAQWKHPNASDDILDHTVVFCFHEKWRPTLQQSKSDDINFIEEINDNDTEQNRGGRTQANESDNDSDDDGKYGVYYLKKKKKF
ncbi:hypothetical protein RFI_12786 [Reticulomyxa filosa]|uniref:Uncharacterized protein n=1 Tax=Reticulomyxa filosa TaxID=46433 RepID=X6NDJ8_RETFI|nr:hypothetical protein RFI_12786 [Reticulomyxa filosa]|eukprot:ETO24370.1 hypothetical protein RFI_12786 [Reticulomyxa filosa]